MIIISIVVIGCKKSEDLQLDARVDITVNAITDANDGSNGIGEFVFSSSESIDVLCNNCGDLRLDFNKKNDDSSEVTSEFRFPFVENTYLCRLNLQVRFASGKKPENIKYGLYLCPKDASGEALCDFEKVYETCRLN